MIPEVDERSKTIFAQTLPSTAILDVEHEYDIRFWKFSRYFKIGDREGGWRGHDHRLRPVLAFGNSLSCWRRTCHSFYKISVVIHHLSFQSGRLERKSDHIDEEDDSLYWHWELCMSAINYRSPPSFQKWTSYSWLAHKITVLDDVWAKFFRSLPDFWSCDSTYNRAGCSVSIPSLIQIRRHLLWSIVTSLLLDL